MDITYIEPCCADKQLPPLLRDFPMTAFQTNGDVTFLTLIKAVSYLAGNSLDITLMVPEVDVDMLRVLDWYARRGWLASATVITATDRSELIKSELSTAAKVTACHHNKVVDSMLVIDGEDGTVVVQGPLLSKVVPGFRCFTAAFGKPSSPVIRLCTATLRSLIRRCNAPASAKNKKSAKKID